MGSPHKSMSKDNTRNSAIAVDVRFRSGKSPHTILKRTSHGRSPSRGTPGREGSVFQYGIGHDVDFTCESGLYKPVLASAREVISPD